MGVYIKGMEMPTSCWACPMVSGYGIFRDKGKPICEVLVCKALHKKVINGDGIPSVCPLVPVPPHGRLIDADAIPFVESENGCQDDYAFRYDINEMPTIIPAEGKGYILAPQEEYDGLKRKYVVLKSDTGEIVENCFVLRPDKDKAAIAALLAYADATDNQVLAKDIRAWISTIPAEEGE